MLAPMRKSASIVALLALGLACFGACGGRVRSERLVGGAGTAGAPAAAGNGAVAGLANGGSSMSSCLQDDDCMLVSNSCCGFCEPVDAPSVQAINRRTSDEYTDMICGGDIPPCAPCPQPTVVDRNLKYFEPVCDAGRCAALDLRKTTATECATEAECVLRNGTSCCESCGGSDWVAVNAKANFCTRNPSPECDDCAPQKPDYFTTECAEGRCTLVAFPL